jgi:hypothetical protein
MNKESSVTKSILAACDNIPTAQPPANTIANTIANTTVNTTATPTHRASAGTSPAAGQPSSTMMIEIARSSIANNSLPDGRSRK